MTDPTLVFVHSPLVGPLTGRAVADRFTAAGRRTVVADLRGAVAGPGPYVPAIVRRVAEAAAPLTGDVVLVGHSGAGPLLPAIAAGSPQPVRAVLFVDAGLPHPGRSWWQTTPAQLTRRLQQLADGGRLPPWHRWFPADTLAELLADARVRDAFTAEVPSLPLAYFHEPMPAAHWRGPAGYLLLSEAYRDDADRARRQGMPVVELSSHHLGTVSAPEAVAAALEELLAALPPARPQRPAEPGGC